MSPDSLLLTIAHWPLVLTAMGEVEPSGDHRAALIAAGIYEADGRTPTPVAASALAGLRGARRVITVRTARAAQAADLDLYLAPGTSTSVERLGDRLLVSPLRTSVVPVRIARQLGLGPRPSIGSPEPVLVSAELPSALFAGDHPRLLAAVASLVETFALADVAVADALEDGDWTASALTVAVGHELVAALAVLDTRAGLFAVGPGQSAAQRTLERTSPSGLWPRLGVLTTLPARTAG